MSRGRSLIAWLGWLALLVATARFDALAQGGSAIVIRPNGGNLNQLISFTFRQADIDDVLRFLADASGRVIFKDPSVSLSVTIENRSRITVADAFKLVGALLAVRGFAMIDAGDYVIVTTAADARARRGARVGIGVEPEKIPAGREVIMQVFQLKFLDAVRLREELQPLFPQGQAVMVANGQTNSLLVIDEADNVRRIAEVVRSLDQDLSEAIQVEVIPLRHAQASEIASILENIFRQDDPLRGLPENVRAQLAQQGRLPTQGLAQLQGRVRVAAHTTQNAVVVSASPGNLEQIKRLIAELDVDVAPREEYRIVELKYADATALADQVNALVTGSTGGVRLGGFGGFGFPFGGGFTRPGGGSTSQGDLRVVPDVRTNRVVIRGPVDSARALEELVRSLDSPTHVTEVVQTFQLQHAVASEVANSLRQLFLGSTAQQGFGFALFGAQRAQLPPGSPLDLLRQVTIIPHDQTNQLLISGPSQTFPLIRSLIESLDRRMPQVFIEVVIADISLDAQTQFGIEWNVMRGESTFGTDFGLQNPQTTEGLRYSIVSRNFSAILRALKAQNRVRVISTPHVMVSDNSPAVISIGESIPYAANSNVTGGGVVQVQTDFRDVAITLNVTPHISPGDQILMDVDQQVNSLLDFVQIAPGQLAPRTTNRHAGTTVTVGNGQTIVIGGILSDQVNRRVRKVPILGDLPLIGNLFRSVDRQTQRSELVVFLTPHVVREPADVDALREFERQRIQIDPLQLGVVEPLDAFTRRRREAAPPLPPSSPDSGR